MKKILSVFASAAILATAIQLPSNAQPKTNYVGPAIFFGNGNSAFGVQGKFGLSNNFSVRPVIAFPSGGNTIFGALATYDFDLPGQSSTKFEPFAGVGFLTGSGNTAVYAQVGTDIEVSENIVITGDLKFPLSNGNSTLFGIGAGFKF
jgi:opacity protein-like surface antigen